MGYATRNHAFVPARVWEIRDGILSLDDGKEPPRLIPLSEVRSLRLEFAPTRMELNRYRCTLLLQGGQTVEFFNRRYRGIADFQETSAEYTAFVGVLLAALSVHAPACRFLGGASTGGYALAVAGLIVALAALALLAVLLPLYGGWWLVIVKAALIMIYLPTAWRWLRRNWARSFDPSRPPPEVLPKNI